MEFIGRDSFNRLHSVLKGKVLVFTTVGIFNLFNNQLLEQLSNKNFVVFDKISPNPKIEDVEYALKVLSKERVDCILAFGGGSVIDFAKAYKFYKKINIPLIAVPTTAGTGSQVTQFAAIYVRGEKHSIDDPFILPDASIVDSQFVEKAPKYLKACTSLDAYCQAIESFFAVRSNELSQNYAYEAMAICKKYIKNAVLSSDPIANEKIAYASHLAGKAINISRTTAAHALAYKITTMYHIPHGHAVALSMIDLIKANLQVDKFTCNDNRGVDYVKSQLNKINKLVCGDNDFTDYWKELMISIGLEWNINKFGVDKKLIISSVNNERLKNNPKNLCNDLNKFWSI